MNFFVDQHNFTIYATQSRIHNYINLYVYSFTSTVYKIYSVRFANFTFLQELRVYSIYTLHVNSLLYPFSQRCSTYFYPIFSQKFSAIQVLPIQIVLLYYEMFIIKFSTILLFFFTKILYNDIFSRRFWSNSFSTKNLYCPHVFMKILHNHIFFAKILYNPIFSTKILN